MISKAQERYIAQTLMRRGGKARLIKELASRNSMVNSDRTVYSTEGRLPDAKPRRGLIRGEIPASSDIKQASYLEATSGRTVFHGKGRTFQEPRIRVFGEHKHK